MQRCKKSAHEHALLSAVPAAIVLVLASTSSKAQDTPTSSTASEPVTTLSKPAKQKPAAAIDNTTAKTVKQGSEKEGTPPLRRARP
jgi:hypothetical protein